MRVHGRVAVSGEVLGGREDALALQPADHRRSQFGHQPGVVSERAGADHGVAEVLGKVENRREVDIAAQGQQLPSQDAACPLRQLGGAARAQRHVAWQLGDAAGHGHQLAALLVDANQRWKLPPLPGGLVKQAGGSSKLARRLDVVGEEADRGDRAVAHPFEHPRRGRVAAVGDHQLSHCPSLSSPTS
jgi:hypothetical protein